MPAVLCDLDGLLVDSEILHFEAYRIVLAEYGIRLTVEHFVDGWLSGNRYGTKAHLESVGATSPEDFENARAKKSALFRELSKGKLELMPGAAIFLKRVKEAGIPCGVGTGGYRSEYEFIAEECDLWPYVQVFVGGDDVENNKPSPDIFEEVAARLGVPKKECVVFENSDIGLRAATSAGIRCIVAPSPLTRRQDFSAAEKIVTRLDEVDLATLFS